MRFWQLCLGLMLGCISLTKAQSPCRPFPVQATFQETTLQGYLYAAHTTDTALSRVKRADFKLVAGGILNVGYDTRQHWLRYCITNLGNRSQALVFGVDFAHIDDLSIYVLDESNNTVPHRWKHLGRHTPIANRPLASRVFAFPFSIQAGQTLTVYGRFKRQRSILLLPVKLMTREQFFNNGFSFDVTLYMGLGVLFIASLVSLVLFAVTRQSPLLYYMVYVLAYAVATLSLEGIWGQYLPTIRWLDENTHLVMFALCAFAQIQFVVTFLHLDRVLPRLAMWTIRAFAMSSLLLATYLLVAPFSYMNSALLSSWVLTILGLVVGLIGWSLKKQLAGASLLLVSFLPALLIGFWFTSSVLLALPRSWHFYQISYLIPFWQLIILGVGLGVRLVQEQHRALLAVGQLQRERGEAIIQTQESERQRIAADLHDDLGGTLATVYRQFLDIRQQLPHSPNDRVLQQLEALLKKSTFDLRRIAHNLMPPEFALLGLRYTLEQLVKSQPERTPQFSFMVVGTELRLALIVELNAYRIVSELIQNIHKHAHAQRAAVQLLYYADQLIISVEDDGIGSQTAKESNKKVGIGLKNSNLRADYIGATLWHEVSDSGTLIMLEIPYVRRSDATTQTVSPVIS